ncbi:sugar kinase [Streptococcus agalactiae]|uniref:sugar kinase n=1 Tax=Streptococcus agalactiae TaxID=1311 RepID=UPI0006402631|nr:sugar kinase [Streptococcus agalactiae]KLK85264.1 2-dehydro-3-deoxygluconokinase [Streptococcus agalactiae]
MAKIISLGEVLLRLSPPQYHTLMQANHLKCQFGGSELNVLASLAQLGHHVGLVSALPDNDLGKMARQFILSQQITPALTKDLYEVTRFLMTKAKEGGVKVSIDLNFRESLWSSFQEAREQLSPLLGLSDVCFGLEPIYLAGESEDLKDELGLSRPYLDIELLEKITQKIVQEYGLDYIAFTQREMGYTNQYMLKSYLYHNNMLYQTDKTGVEVLDRVGTGDAFAAGLIHALLEKETPQRALEIAMTTFKYKHTIQGDINIMTRDDIAYLIEKETNDIKR